MEVKKHIMLASLHSYIEKLNCLDPDTQEYKCPICLRTNMKNITRFVNHLSDEYVFNKSIMTDQQLILCETANSICTHRNHKVLEDRSNTGDTNAISSKQSFVNTEKFYHDLICFFLTANISFSEISNKYFAKMLQDLGTECKLPDRQKLSGKYLESVFTQTLKSLGDILKNAKRVYLSFDGTSNVNQEKYINVVAIIEHKPYLYSMYNVTDCGETSDTIAYIIYDCISRIGFNKVKGIISDNCSVNISSREKVIQKIHDSQNSIRYNSIQPPEYEPKELNIENNGSILFSDIDCSQTILSNCDDELYFFGCSSHICELLLGDFFESIDSPRNYLSPKDVIAAVNNIAFFFKYHTSERLELAIESYHDYRNNTPKLSCPTRWWSEYSSLKWLLDHKEKLQQYAYQHANEKNNDIVSNLNNNKFWVSCMSILDILDILKTAVQELESNNASVSDVYYYYKQFLRISNNSPYQNLFNSCLKKREYFFLHPLYLLAYYLNIKNKNEVENNDHDMEIIVKYLQEADNKNLFPVFLNYIHNAEIFTEITVLNSFNMGNNKTYWQTVNLYEKNLSSLALLLDDAPPSSGFSERVWSQMKIVQNKLRNRLSFYRIARILFIRCNLPYINSYESTFFDSDDIDIEELINRQDLKSK
ncbi:hypothetical protein WA158_000313 [Blastocystis sp. Blastoise]